MDREGVFKFTDFLSYFMIFNCMYNLVDYQVISLYIKLMQYEWDENKRLANLVRHKVDFTDAVNFEWDTALETIDDRFDYGEERWVALGFIGTRLHVLVYTFRAAKIRIISLRKATKRERLYYEKQT